MHCGMRAFGQRRRFHARLRQRAVQFLPPMRDVARRPVAVHHPQRSRADIRELVKDFRWDVNRLACRESCTLLAQAHLAFALDDEVDFFLLLVVPRHLSAVRLERDVAHREVRRLNGAGSPRRDSVCGGAPDTSGLRYSPDRR